MSSRRDSIAAERSSPIDVLSASLIGLVPVFAWPTYGLFELAPGVPFPPGRLLGWLGYGG